MDYLWLKSSIKIAKMWLSTILEKIVHFDIGLKRLLDYNLAMRRKKPKDKIKSMALRVPVTAGQHKTIMDYCDSIDSEFAEWARALLLAAVKQPAGGAPAPHAMPAKRQRSPDRY